MAGPLLCSIGCCTDTTAKVCVVADGAANTVRLAYRVNGGDVAHRDVTTQSAPPYRLASIDLQGLTPGAKISYAVDAAADAESLRTPEELHATETASFRLLPTDRPVRVGVISCNGVHKVSRADRYAMWERLAEVVDAGEVDLLLHVGDQIYADALKETHEVCAATGDVDELASAYREWTLNTWRAPQVARVLGACPSMMMWDDHDIYDGWGSNDDDREPDAQTFYAAAKRVFREFQAVHNPPTIDPDSFATGFVHNGLGVLMVDVRTHRDYSRGTIVGDDQWAAIDAWLNQAYLQGLRHLFVVVGTPPVHLRVALDLWIHEITPWTESATDDLRDAWISKNNQPEAERLVDRLFDFQVKSPQTRVSIVAGDVHVATVGRLESTNAQHLGGDAPASVHQIVSSPIGYKVPSGIAAWLLRRATKKRIDVAPGVFGELLDLDGVDTDRVLLRRNFAVIHGEDGSGEWHPDAELRVRYYAEGIDAPLDQKLPRG